MSDSDGRRQLRNVRVADDIADWAQAQARERGVGLGVIVEESLRLLRRLLDDEDEMPVEGWGDGMTSDQLRARYGRVDD